MKVCFWGVRGSVPVPDAGSLRYGGNTSCVSVELGGGGRLVLDAGTGIRSLGLTIDPVAEPIHIMLTHLHLDHISGLLFFAPLFHPEANITIWGPPGPGDLRQRLARYLSAPLSPVEIRDLPARVTFRECSPKGWRVGDAFISATQVVHRGPTLGYRIEEGGAAIAYIPDHEPGLGQDLDRDRGEWISGFGLARGASLLIHDGQYTRAEYALTQGWGHSRIDDALCFGRRTGAERVALFHHDPAHDDERLDALSDEALSTWSGDAELTFACEGQAIDIA